MDFFDKQTSIDHAIVKAAVECTPESWVDILMIARVLPDSNAPVEIELQNASRREAESASPDLCAHVLALLEIYKSHSKKQWVQATYRIYKTPLEDWNYEAKYIYE